MRQTGPSFSVMVLVAMVCGPVWGDAPELLVAPQRLVRVDAMTPETVAALKEVLRAPDVAGTSDRGASIDIVTTAAERELLAQAGVAYELLPEPDAGLRATYHSFSQMEAALATMASTYPNITQLFSIGTSYEGRPIWCLEISDNPGTDEGEPGVQFMGLHHAREWPSLEVSLDIADRLTSLYSRDLAISGIVNNTRVWVIPCVNPDGYVYDYNTGNYWRKNRRPVGGSIGVDLNRNYDGGANGMKEGAWGSIGDGSQSHQPSQDTYVGPTPFSEPETQAIRDFIAARDITLSISYHTYSELVLWSWGFASVTTDDNALMSSIGQGIAAAIGGYTPQQAVGLYPTTGASDDWTYGYQYYVKGKNTLAYTVEIGTSFHPSASALQGLLDTNWYGALFALQQAATAKAQMTPFVLPPTLSPPVTDADGDFTVSWTQTNPGAGANLYELQELAGLTLATDGAESGLGHWDNEQFVVSSTRSHSGSQSFKSPSGNERIAAMTTTSPLPVELGDSLSFWTWYDIETDWDMAMLEVSIDGFQFDVLDTFTGASGGWSQRSYSLDAYAGHSIHIRFRYTSDSAVEEEGIYIDDVYPVANWASVSTLSSSIAGTSYAVTGKADGDYHYRVRGSNAARGFGAFSDVRTTRVVSGLGDADGDGDFDLEDFGVFQLCFGGDGAAVAASCPAPSTLFDLDADGDVDSGDLSILAQCMGGPGAVNPACPF